MTIEEATERYKKIFIENSCWVKNCDGNCDECSAMDEIILEALEKYTPKIPTVYDRIKLCPNCGSVDIKIYNGGIDIELPYCYNCGQALLWKDKAAKYNIDFGGCEEDG